MGQRGFTLLEMLAVLVMTSLLFGILISGLSHILGLRADILEYSIKQQRETLQEHWIRSTVAGLTPTTQRSANRFQGTDDKIKGVTLAPLSAVFGAPTPMLLELVKRENRVWLEYQPQGGERWSLAAWDAADAFFEFGDGKGGWSPSWPRNARADTQLPAEIRLTINSLSDERMLLIHVPGSKKAVFDINEVFR